MPKVVLVFSYLNSFAKLIYLWRKAYLLDLSICIPVYNQAVQVLVEQLKVSAIAAKLQFEIIILDDSSTDAKTKVLNQIYKKSESVLYKELAENIGRARIRNSLAALASADFLLFLDDDSLLKSPNTFIKNYWDSRDSKSIICGGRIYPDSVDPSFLLHWKYGKKYESKNSKVRSEKPYSSFHSNNFLISKETFNKIKFNEKLTNYGHEDSYFAFQLKKKSIDIKHINNEVIHSSLEDNSSFLDKTDKAIENLIQLIRSEENSEFENFIRLSSTYKNAAPAVKYILWLVQKIFIKGLRKRIISESKPELIQLYKILKYNQLYN